MQRLAAVFLLLLPFVLGGFHGAARAQVDVTKVKVIEIPVIPAKEGQTKAIIRGGPQDDEARWWNDRKIVKALSLTDEQRDEMGRLVKVYRAKLLPVRRLDHFHETLVQGDWKAARSESAKIAKNAETSVGSRGSLKIDVLSVLNTKQLVILVDRFPRLIYKRWDRAMRATSSR